MKVGLSALRLDQEISLVGSAVVVVIGVLISDWSKLMAVECSGYPPGSHLRRDVFAAGRTMPAARAT